MNMNSNSIILVQVFAVGGVEVWTPGQVTWLCNSREDLDSQDDYMSAPATWGEVVLRLSS